MKHRSSISFLLIFFSIGFSGLLLFSCGKKSMEGRMVLTQVAGKVHDSWKSNTPARIVVIDPAHPESSVKVLTEGYYCLLQSKTKTMHGRFTK